MSMPQFHEFFLPVLIAARERDALSVSDAREFCASYYALDNDELTERLKSGECRFNNRVNWAFTYLDKAGMIEKTAERGIYRITVPGITFLESHPEQITLKDLGEASPEFKAWRAASTKRRGKPHADKEKPNEEGTGDTLSPAELFQDSYDELMAALADELIDTIVQSGPDFFEHLVAKLLTAMGYGDSTPDSITVTPSKNDGGIDGIIKEDKLGFDNVYYQAKCYGKGNNVQRPEIQEFVGSLMGLGASKGLFITTSFFSKGALNYAKDLKAAKVVLVDGPTLANLMIDYNIGVDTVNVYEIKRIDNDFFRE